MNNNIIVNVGDLVLGVIPAGRCRGSDSGLGARQARQGTRIDPGQNVVVAGGGR